MLSQKPEISRYPQVILTQKHVEQALLDLLSREGRLLVERNTRPTKLIIDEDCLTNSDAHPITVVLELSNKTESTVQHPRVKSDREEEEKQSKSVGTETTHRVDNPQPCQKEIVRTKYLIGCDGARSWTRVQLGIPMQGERTNNHFGVMDILPLTNFRMPEFLEKSLKN